MFDPDFISASGERVKFDDFWQHRRLWVVAVQFYFPLIVFLVVFWGWGSFFWHDVLVDKFGLMCSYSNNFSLKPSYGLLGRKS